MEKMQHLSFSRIVDLGHTITQDMPHLPGEQETLFEYDQQDRTQLHAVQMSPRSATHITIVASEKTSPRTVDQFAPGELVVPAVVLDMRENAQDAPGYRVQVEHIQAWEQQHGPVPAGCMVLLATGWDMRWHDPDAYLNLDNQGNPRVPGFAPSAVAWLANERNVQGVGIDTPVPWVDIAEGGENGAAKSGGKDRAPMLVLTNLARLEQLPPVGTTLVMGVLNLQHSSSGPVRVLALVP